MGAAPYGAKAKGADAPARRLRDIRRVHSWARRYYWVKIFRSNVKNDSAPAGVTRTVSEMPMPARP